MMMYFNPLSRMEKDLKPIVDKNRIGISIHSLAWRKTSISPLLQSTTKISIHSLAWRKTTLIIEKKLLEGFQSTLSHGERHSLYDG